jgi:hypothetical protein
MIRLLSATGCLAALLSCSGASGGDKAAPKQGGKGEQVLTDFLKQRNVNGGQVVALTATPLSQAFPGHHFFAVRFRQFPVARILPEGMRASNLFAVMEDKVAHLKTGQALEAFFRAHAPAVKEEADATGVVQSWLWLTQEFVQDGFYKFELEKMVSSPRTSVPPSDPRCPDKGGRGRSLSGSTAVACRFPDCG